MKRKTAVITTLLLCITCLCHAGEVYNRTNPRIAYYFEKARPNLAELVSFLHKMPKGADLHNHPSGAVNTESIIRLAQEMNLYFDRDNLTLTRHKPEGRFYESKEFTENHWKHGEIVEALSLRNRELAGESGHARFFRSFDRFAVVLPYDLPVYKEVMRRAVNQEITHLELMTIPTADPDWRDIVEKARLDVLAEFAARGLERELTVRFIYPLVRVSILAEPDVMRSQMEKALSAVAAMPDLFKGITILAPEDDPQSQKYFREHMEIIAEGMRLARERYESEPGRYPPPPRLMIHAGELTIEYATYESMTDRLSSVLRLDGVSRIGHGTCVMWDDDVYGVLRAMRERGIAVEFCPSSSEGILKTSGRAHPFLLYWRAGVPVVVATDDEGVARSNLTLEYAKAAQWFDLTYGELKWLAFNSLEYSFLDGESYFSEGDYNRPRADAGPLSEKARAQERLLERFDEFESRMEKVLDGFGW